MNLFIAASHPAGRMHPIVEVVDDYESFSPGLLSDPPLREVEHINAFMAGVAYARSHGLTPIELVFTLYGHRHLNDDGMWALDGWPRNNRVYRATSPDGELRVVIVQDHHQIDYVRLGVLRPCYPLEGVLMPAADTVKAAEMIAGYWFRDIDNGEKAGQFIFPHGFGIAVDGREELDETL